MAPFSKYKKALAAVKAKIDKDITSHTTIRQLAEIAGVSETKLKTLFRDAYGNSIYTYLKDKRITEAKRLLRDTSLPLAEVAEKTGFKFHTNFVTFFSKHTSRSPISYRKSPGKRPPKE